MLVQHKPGSGSLAMTGKEILLQNTLIYGYQNLHLVSVIKQEKFKPV